MPRGVYDRSKAKSRKGTSTGGGTGGGGGGGQTKTAQRRAGAAGGGGGTGMIASGGHGNITSRTSERDLHVHLNVLLEARTRLGAQNIELNQTVLGALDSELIQTVNAMSRWREQNFPYQFQGTMGQATGQNVGAPQIQQPQVQQPAPAPLPFSPQNVQEVLRQQ